MNGAEILGASLVSWLTVYGYWFLIPIMIIEGTTVGFAAGALASIGVFNPYVLFAVYVSVRIIADTVIYQLAWHGSHYLERIPVARTVLLRIRGDGENNREFAEFIDNNFFSSLFLAKVLPLPTLDGALLVAAGTLKISAKRVYTAILAGQPIWSAMIIGLGYFFGDTIQNPNRLINWVGFTIGVIIVLVVLYNKYVHNYVLERTKMGRLLRAMNEDGKMNKPVKKEKSREIERNSQ